MDEVGAGLGSHRRWMRTLLGNTRHRMRRVSTILLLCSLGAIPAATRWIC